MNDAEPPSQEHLLGFQEKGGPRHRGACHKNKLLCRLPISDNFGLSEGKPGWKGILYPVSYKSTNSLFPLKGTLSFRKPSWLPSPTPTSPLTTYCTSSLAIPLSAHLTVIAIPATHCSFPITMPLLLLFLPWCASHHSLSSRVQAELPLETGPFNGDSFFEPSSGLYTQHQVYQSCLHS